MSRNDNPNKGKGAPPTDWPVPTTGGVHHVVDGELVTEAEFKARDKAAKDAPAAKAAGSKNQK